MQELRSPRAANEPRQFGELLHKGGFDGHSPGQRRAQSPLVSGLVYELDGGLGLGAVDGHELRYSLLPASNHAREAAMVGEVARRAEQAKGVQGGDARLHVVGPPLMADHALLLRVPADRTVAITRQNRRRTDPLPGGTGQDVVGGQTPERRGHQLRS